MGAVLGPDPDKEVTFVTEQFHRLNDDRIAYEFLL